MKHIATIFLLLGMLLFIAGPVIAQLEPEEGDYRTFESGDWNDAAIWDVFSEGDWQAANVPPSGSETITVLEGDSVFVNVEVTITGQLVDQGRIESNDNLIIGDGGVYQHDQDAGFMPLIVWEEGATLLVTGVETEAPADRNQNYHHIIFDTPGLLSNLNMDLDDVTIGGDIRVVNTGLARWYLTSALATDSSIVTIMGNVFVESGAFSVQGTSNAQTTFIVHHYGNIEVTGGNFSISRGSQPGGTTTWYLYEGDFSMSNATTQSSTTTVGGAKFVFAKDGIQTLTLGEGNNIMALPIEVASGTTLQMGESALAGSGTFDLNEGAILGTALAGGVASIFADVVGVVNLEAGSGYAFNGTDAQSTSAMMPDTVGDLIIRNPAVVALSQETHILGMLGLGNGVFDNSAGFTRGENFMLGTGHPDGISAVDGQLTEPVDFSEVENFAFIGTENQLTSDAMSATVQNLTIDNPERTTLSQATTVNGVLRLLAGLLDISAGLTLGPEAEISFEGGDTTTVLVSVEIISHDIPESFFVSQNYPNPFNPSTKIRFGLSTSSHVAVKVYNMLGQEVATLVDGWKDAGQYEIVFDAGNLSSGVYLCRVQAGDAVTTKRMMLIR